MKSRLLSDDKIDEFINKLTESIFDAKIEKENLISWELFFDELFMSDNHVDMYNTGAIALGISALCTSKKRETVYKDTIKKASSLLKELRNQDGSWSVSASVSTKGTNGIVYNTVVSLEALLEAGILNINEVDMPKEIDENLEYVFRTIEWLYNQKITKSNSQYFGWGYSGDRENKIYIMPTVNVLVLFKKVYFELALRWKKQLDKQICNKSLLELINETQDSLYSFRVSPEDGWGKEVTEHERRIVYTLYGLYGLSYSAYNVTEDITYPEDKITNADVDIFTKYICSWKSEKKIDHELLGSINPDNYFDSYIQKNATGNDEIIDHESFLESISLLSIICFVRKYKKKIKKSRQSQVYQVIIKLCNSLKDRILTVDIKGKAYTVVRSRRGLLSQSYPIYAITQAANSLIVVKANKSVIKDLMKYKGWIFKIVGFVIQVAALYAINYVAMPLIPKATLLLVSIVAPVSEYIKNWIFSFSKLEE